MKLLLIVLSLAANVALAVLLARDPELAPAGLEAFLRRHGAGTPAPDAMTSTVRRGVPPKMWTLLDSGDLKTLIARLRAAGFPPEIVRYIVQQRVNRQFRDRFQDPDAPYWKGAPQWTPERQAKLAAISRERSRLERELFSDPWFHDEAATAQDQRRYGNLPAAKIDLLRRIEDDYDEMNQQIRAGTKGILLDEDKAKLVLLRQEKAKDLAAVLSPDELADYQMRTSSITSTIARQLGGFDPTEAEFRGIYAAYQQLSVKFADASFAALNPDDILASRGDFAQQIKAALGDERAAEFFRETNPEYQQLKQMAGAAGLADNVPADVFRLRDETAAASQKIADDSTINRRDKVTALKQLADDARVQLSTLLGSAAPQYLPRAESWLIPLAHGNWITFQPPITIVGDNNNSMAMGSYAQPHPLPRRKP